VTEELELPGSFHALAFSTASEDVRRFAEVAGAPFYVAEAPVAAAAPM
jgi:hypothetical protein